MEQEETQEFEKGLEKELEKELELVKKQLLKKIQSFDKAIDTTHASLEKGKTHDEARYLAELIKANYSQLQRGMENISLADWKNSDQEICIPLDPTLSPKEQLEGLFRKSKKLQRSIAPLQVLLTRLKADKEKYSKAVDELATIQDFDSLDIFKGKFGLIKPEKKQAVKKPPYHVYTSEHGIKIFVGKNSESNHILTFQVANGSDLWLHAHAVSGAHVVVRKEKGQEVDPETLHDALQLALFYSKAKNHPNMRHEVTVTERKYVSRTPSAPKGLAYVSKHKIMTACIDLKRIERLKKNKL